ncbi:hypothetical protein GCM10007867_27460 [Gluconobacter cerinus]|uniref:Uncharacterized protein n=1 Tax=Gluconobacter cerinus TaxID=38307 RepID=A0AAV5NIQ5_9PROT|nr:hypothetical protein GCM10007867_27460 [Gluconobacter cerinus]
MEEEGFGKTDRIGDRGCHDEEDKAALPLPPDLGIMLGVDLLGEIRRPGSARRRFCAKKQKCQSDQN